MEESNQFYFRTGYSLCGSEVLPRCVQCFIVRFVYCDCMNVHTEINYYYYYYYYKSRCI